MIQYVPDWTCECRICGTIPCVRVISHSQPETSLCGPHFFDDPTARSWADWNDREDSPL